MSVMDDSMVSDSVSILWAESRTLWLIALSSVRASVICRLPTVISVRPRTISPTLSDTSAMVPVMAWTEASARVVKPWAERMPTMVSSSLEEMLAALVAVVSASLRISSATTLKPLPNSPAWAASIAAFMASMPVCEAIDLMISENSLMLSAESAMAVMTARFSSMLSTLSAARWERESMTSRFAVAIRSTLPMEAIISSTALDELAIEPDCASIWRDTSLMAVRIAPTDPPAVRIFECRSSSFFRMLAMFAAICSMADESSAAFMSSFWLVPRLASLTIFIFIIRLWVLAIKTLMPLARPRTRGSRPIEIRLVRSFSPAPMPATADSTLESLDRTARARTKAMAAKASACEARTRGRSPAALARAPSAPARPSARSRTASAANARRKRSPTFLMVSGLYRIRATRSAAPSRASISSSRSFQPSAPAFSSRWASLRAPGIGIVPFIIVQLSAIWAAVLPP